MTTNLFPPPTTTTPLPPHRGFRSPPRPDGVRLCRKVELPATSPARPGATPEPQYRIDRYTCRPVLAGEKDGIQQWRAVCDRPMWPTDWLEVDHLPAGAVITGPPGSTLTTRGLVRDA